MLVHTIHNFLPWGIPWDEGHAVFFGIMYSVIVVLGAALGYVIAKTVRDMKSHGHGGHH